MSADYLPAPIAAFLRQQDALGQRLRDTASDHPRASEEAEDYLTSAARAEHLAEDIRQRFEHIEMVRQAYLPSRTEDEHGRSR